MSDFGETAGRGMFHLNAGWLIASPGTDTLGEPRKTESSKQEVMEVTKLSILSDQWSGRGRRALASEILLVLAVSVDCAFRNYPPPV